MHKHEEDSKSPPPSEIRIEDLPIEEGTEKEIKGGPRHMPIQGVDGDFSPRRP